MAVLRPIPVAAVVLRPIPPATATILRATLTPTRAATATIGEGDAGAGSGSFAEAWDLANQITLELVAAREAAEYRGGLTRILLVFAASSALILAVAEGVTSRRRARRAFRIDAATGLVNRGAFARELNAMMRHKDVTGVFALKIDVDTLSDVARTAGATEADAFFHDFVRRLVPLMPKSCRIGRGDGYSLVACGRLEDPHDPAGLAIRTLALAHDPLTHLGKKMEIAVSVGYATAENRDGSAEELFRNAELAVSQARQGGQNVAQRFLPESGEHVRDQLALSTALAQAFANDEFVLYYQPIIDAATKKIVGAEALLRWNEPSRGAVSPAEFIPLLEESGRIDEVGTWVLQSAIQQIADWQRAGTRTFMWRSTSH